MGKAAGRGGKAVTTRRDFLKMVGAATAASLVSVESEAQAAPKAQPKPHIVFLMTDQHRGDCLGLSGNTVIKTRNLDDLIRDGIRFEHAYTSTPSCTPARAAILTGLSPWHHGMLAYGTVAERYGFELPRAMHDAGYYTYAIGKLHYHPQRNYHGFDGALLDESGRVQDPGFISDYRKWFKEKAPDLNPDATGITFNDYRAAEYALPEELHPTRWTGDMAVDYIRKYSRKEPMFLKVSFARPHSPYDPPKRFFDMYEDAKMPAPHIAEWAERYAPGASEENYGLWHGDLGIDLVRRARRGYYGSVTFIDEQVGRIVKALEERGMLDNTLILFTADHGDMLGDHHLWRKSYAYEGSTHIPMIVRPPRGYSVQPRRGTDCGRPVELRDVLPTFLDAAGAKIPDKLDGKSLLRLVRGETDGWRDVLDLEHGTCYADENVWHALTNGHWKWVYNAFAGEQQLFDLVNDPGELRDLAREPRYTGILKDWRSKLIAQFKERGEPFLKNGDLAIRREKIVYSPNYPKPPEKAG